MNDGDLARQLIAALGETADARPGVRLNHARGIVGTGTFRAAAGPKEGWAAEMLDGNAVSALVRFSSSTARPDVAQADPAADPRGIALRLSRGSERWDLIGHSVDGFPAATPDEFLRFLTAASRAHHDRVSFEEFLNENPTAGAFLRAIPLPPRSFAAETFYCLHALTVRQSGDVEQVGRVVISGNVWAPRLSDQEAAQMSADYLDRELRDRLQTSPAHFTVGLVPPGPGDALDDISVPWTATGAVVPLGELSITAIGVDDPGLAFDPLLVPEGVAFVGDPMIDVRARAYERARSQR